MTKSYKLTEAAFEDLSAAAKEQAEDMIDSLLRRVVDDVENSDSDSFKLAITIEGTRDGAKVYLQTKAQSSVDLKRKDQTKIETIDPEPGLFDRNGEPAQPAPVQVNVHLIAAEAETLPDGGTVKAEPVGESFIPSPAGAVKLKTVTISNTGVCEASVRENPEWYRELKTMRKAGVATVGDVVQMVLKNPDGNKRFPLGFYRCTETAPAYDDPHDGRWNYTFTKYEDEGPVNGGGDIPDRE